MAFDLAKFLARFSEEAREHIEALNQGLLSLEENPDRETLNAVFRAAHTLKGSSRMLKLTPISEVAHKLEEVLDALRTDKIGYSKELSDHLFAGIDFLSGMVEKVAAGEKLTEDVGGICGELERAAEGEAESAKDEGPAAEAMPGERRSGRTGGGEAGESPTGQRTLGGPAHPAGGTGAEAVHGTPASGGGTEASEPAGPAERGLETPVPGVPAAEKRAGEHGTGGTSAAPDDASHGDGRKVAMSSEETIRVSTKKLDGLIKLAGEISLAHTLLKGRLSEIKSMEKLARRIFMLLADSGDGDSRASGAEVSKAAENLSHGLKQLSFFLTEDAGRQGGLTQELQGSALNLRMLPLSTLFDSFHRTVREAARSLGKKVSFIVEGGETELDKRLIEKIGDPIGHMIRNAVDHGIESPERRLQAGKPETGAVVLSASYEGDSVLIQLHDDGAGLSLDRIKEKAVKKGLFDRETVESLSEAELVNLIFHPGFSTSEIITDISGRGVGMDVVKRNIVEQLGGVINVETREGKGTDFQIKILLTMAVMRVLLVTASDLDAPFAIPTHSVTEALRVEAGDLIDVVGRKAVRLGRQIVPVVNMGDALGLPSSDWDDRKDLLILVISVTGEQMGFIINSLLHEEDMFIRPLPSHMQNNRVVSGVIISGANELINVLNSAELVNVAKEISFGRRVEGKAKQETAAALHILVVDDSINTREIEKSILEAHGYIVTIAGDGVEALAKARKSKFDLVVSDVEMPRMDGFSLTESLRQEDAYRETPIILVTSRDKEEDKRRGMQVGANAYIVKGAFDQSNLLDTIENLV